jgi:hypothetical protein
MNGLACSVSVLTFDIALWKLRMDDLKVHAFRSKLSDYIDAVLYEPV